jgi:Ser/Thr protein kinase RdoA (MazF antagonist)
MLRRMARGADGVEGAGTEIDVLVTLLRERVRRYFPDLPDGEIDVRLRRWRKRPSSTLYEFEVRGPGRSRVLLIKRARIAPEQPGLGLPPVEDRPRLAPFIDPARRRWLEYRALAAVERQFDRGDARYRALRVYDFIPERQAIVMELADGPTLREKVLGASFPWVRPRLDRAFENAGAWLRAFHALREPAGEPRHTTAISFIEVVGDLAGHLGDTLDEPAFFRQVAVRLTERARVVLPAQLPLGLGHGDYAARNVLVGPNDRVTVIDIAANWRAPIYEDIAYFIIGIEAAWVQLVSQGWLIARNDLQRYRESFLTGYFGRDPVPRREVRLYEALLLLDRWVARLWAASRSHDATSIELRLANRSLKRLLDDLVADREGEHQ